VLEIQLEPFHSYADMCTTAIGRLRGLTEQHTCSCGGPWVTVKRSMVYSKRARARRPATACQAAWWLEPQAECTHAQQRVQRACLVEWDLLRREQPRLERLRARLIRERRHEARAEELVGLADHGDVKVRVRRQHLPRRVRASGPHPPSRPAWRLTAEGSTRPTSAACSCLP